MRIRPETSPRAPSEHDSQVAVIQWWNWVCVTYNLPPFALFAIPNAGAGAQKGQAGKMKAEGVRPGIPDLCLAVPYVLEGTFFPGLYIEMKRRPNVPSEAQAEVLDYLRRGNYHAHICWNADEAILVIQGYLRGYTEARSRASKNDLSDITFGPGESSTAGARRPGRSSA